MFHVMPIAQRKKKSVKQKNARQFKFRVNSDSAEIASFNRFTSVNPVTNPQRVISIICANWADCQFPGGDIHIRIAPVSICGDFHLI